MPLRRHGFIACSARQSLKPWAAVQTTAAPDLSLGVLRALRTHIARAYGGMQSTRFPCNRFFRKDANREPAPIEDALVEEGGGQGVAIVSGLSGRTRQEETLRDAIHENRESRELPSSVAHAITEPIASARNNARAALNFLDKNPPELGEVREALCCVVDDIDRAGVILDRVRDHFKKAPAAKASLWSR